MIGTRIKLFRKKLGMTQTELGRRVGLSVSYISLIENGRSGIPNDLLYRFAEELQVTVEQLMGNEEKERLNKVREMLLEAYDVAIRSNRERSLEILQELERDYARELENEEFQIAFKIIQLYLEQNPSLKSLEELESIEIERFPLLNYRYQLVKALIKRKLGYIYEAIAILNQAVKSELALKEEASLDTALMHYYLSNYLYLIEHFHKAYMHTEFCIDYFTDHGYINLLIGLFITRGIIYWKLKHYDQSLTQFNKVLSLLNSSPDELYRARTLSSIGIVYFEKKMYNKAYAYFEQSKKIAYKLGMNHYYHPLYNISYAYFLAGDYENFLKNTYECLEILKSVNDPYVEAKVYENLGDYYCKVERDEEKFVSYYNKAIEINKKFKNDIIAAQICYRLGKELNDKKLLAEAAELYHSYFKTIDPV